MPTFRTIHTTFGLQAMAAAETSGVPINLTEMAVGDGNGNPVTPIEGQTALVREMFRANVNRVFQDPDVPEKFTAELVIPATEGGFTLREVGVFDEDGNLFVVGNLPDTYKPELADGSYADTVVRVEFLVSNADVVSVIVDPNVVVATRSWISNNVTAATIIPGGTTSQVLTKQSNADGDVVWQDADTINVVVDVIEETQTLAALQTDVVLATVTTRGLAVYLDGVRIPQGAGVGEWEPDAVDPDTKLVLGQAYPAGTIILMTQNEPSGSVPFPLIRDQNLADVPDKAVARTNMDVFNKSETRQMAPPGLVAFFARPTTPTGWLKANGAAVSRAAYADLFAVIGTVYGVGDGFTTFNLPDLRGEFVRGWDDGRGVDPTRTIGSAQAGAFASHTHGGQTDAQGSHAHTGGTDAQGSHSHTGSTDTQGAHTHPVNDPAHLHAIQHAPDSSTAGPHLSGNATGSGSTPSSTDAAYTGISIVSDGAHLHNVNTSTAGAHAHLLTTNAAGSHMHSVTTYATGGTETRPRNIALLACIKY